MGNVRYDKGKNKWIATLAGPISLEVEIDLRGFYNVEIEGKEERVYRVGYDHATVWYLDPGGIAIDTTMTFRTALSPEIAEYEKTYGKLP